MAILGAPGKTNMEPKNGGLEDDFPFQTCDFSDTVLVFRGSISVRFLECTTSYPSHPKANELFFMDGIDHFHPFSKTIWETSSN